MKINREKFPILGAVEEYATNQMTYHRVFVEALGPETILSMLEDLTSDTQVKLLSSTFFKAFQKVAHRIEAVPEAWLAPTKDEKNVIIIGELGVWIAYEVKDQQITALVGENSLVTGFFETRQNNQLAGYIINNQHSADAETLGVVSRFWRMLIFFINNCEIQEKLLPPKTNTRIKLDTYNNLSKANVTIVNSTWFTTLISKHAHTVSGHFRWQPYGKGRTMYKLIWIDEFEKQGFVKPARVLKHNLEHPANKLE